MGIYCINRKTIERLKPGEPYGFDNLMLDGTPGRPEDAAPALRRYWPDIGRPEDYETADANFAEIKTRLGVA